MVFYVDRYFLVFVAAVFPHLLIVAAVLVVVVAAVFLLHPHHRLGGCHQSKCVILYY